MTNLLIVMGGGAVGAGARYLLGRIAGHLAPGASWPWGTFAANLLGGLAMGLLAGWLARAHAGAGTGEPIRLLLGVGLLGGFTTFSSFSLETMLLIERGQWALGVAYALASLVGAVVALALGLQIMRSVA
ncbi:CrcB protein [Sphingobium sp. OAS761]|uniref:fluoride efflux transporter CrcB n=1 Tax=Sphingobium sp. OAS761 TaxID=2817901 RepID=UPI0020A1E72C|nr:fluoride efflux transporter CrcB [Sphingobium sp. OAS761]MCP1469403.1 CrcB protein [Sphingobium sp. OAS761]